jgi:hypothetical protein
MPLLWRPRPRWPPVFEAWHSEPVNGTRHPPDRASIAPVHMTRQVVPSGGPFEPIYGCSRAVDLGTQVHVAGRAARDETRRGYSASAYSTKCRGG